MASDGRVLVERTYCSQLVALAAKADTERPKVQRAKVFLAKK